MDSQLEHYGVKGMRWGVRRSASTLAKTAAGKGYSKIAKRQSKKANKARAAVKSMESQRKQLTTMKDRKGNQLFTNKQVDTIVSKYKNQGSKYSESAKGYEALSKSLINGSKNKKIKVGNKP